METAHCVPILVAVRYALPYTDRAFTCSRLRYTRSVGITPLLFGCSAPQQVQRYVTGAALITSAPPHETPTGAAPRNQAPTATQHSNGSSGPQRSATHHHNRHNTSRNTPDPSALHPFCSGAALRNGCSATQRVQRHATGAAPRNGCLPSDLCPARRRICNDDNSRTLDDRGGSYCFRPQHQPWHPVHRHATNRRSRHRTRRRPASCPPARDQPMLLRAAVAAFKTGVAVSQPSERYETVRHDAIASSCRSFLHVANAEEPTATATATATATSRNHHTLRSLGCARQRDITPAK